jgi:hypothetical protein
MPSPTGTRGSKTWSSIHEDLNPRAHRPTVLAAVLHIERFECADAVAGPNGRRCRFFLIPRRNGELNCSAAYLVHQAKHQYQC